MRLQIDVSESHLKELEDLMARADITTKKELFNYAINLLEWAVKESEKGNVIASVDEKDGRYREIQMPVFSAAARNARHEAPSTVNLGVATSKA